MLSPNNELAAFFSWITGWINFVGQFAVTTGITFGCANLIATLATVKGTFAYVVISRRIIPLSLTTATGRHRARFWASTPLYLSVTVSSTLSACTYCDI